MVSGKSWFDVKKGSVLFGKSVDMQLRVRKHFAVYKREKRLRSKFY